MSLSFWTGRERSLGRGVLLLSASCECDFCSVLCMGRREMGVGHAERDAEELGRWRRYGVLKIKSCTDDSQYSQPRSRGPH